MNAVSQPQRYPISVEQYHRMGEAGLFPPDARLELIDGEILTVPPMGIPHRWAVAALTRAIIGSPLGGLVFLLPQLSVILSDFSEPEPDISLLRLPEDQYRTRAPVAADIVLLVEVSDSTLPFDRQRKMPLYARHGVPESWVVNIPNRRLEVFRRPEHGIYTDLQELEPGTQVRLEAFPDIAFDWSVALG
jgi:Uma2 family endonuclease